MPAQEISLGLGSVVYALAKADGCIEPDEALRLQQLLTHEPHGDLAWYAFQLHQRYDKSYREAYGYALRRFANNRHELDEPQKARFVRILEQVASADANLANRELALIHQFQNDLRAL
jgi:uncharacterized tellurite resistance protein B-like protein